MLLARILLILAVGGCFAGLEGCAIYEKCGFHGCTGDAEISSSVQVLFSQHPVLLPPNLIQVQVLDHVVYLTGIVDTDLERNIASEVAGQAPGVTRVVISIGLSGGR